MSKIKKYEVSQMNGEGKYFFENAIQKKKRRFKKN